MIKNVIGQGILTLLIISQISSFASAESAHNTPSSSSHFSLPPIDKTELEEQLSHTKDEFQQLELLSQLATFYIEWEADAVAADSLLTHGIELAEITYNNTLLLNAYANYLIVIDDYTYSKKVEQIINKLTDLAPQISEIHDVWKCKYALAKGYQLIFNNEKAKDYAYQALTSAIQINDIKNIIATHLVLGDVQQKMNNNVEAIRNYLDALTIAEAEEDAELRMDCYDRLSNFYNLIKAYDKSIQYKLKELNLAETESSPDSIRIMTLKFDLEVIAFNNRTVNEKQLYKILEFADKHHVEKLKKFGLVAFRNHLIKQNDLAQLFNLFNNEFPAELQRIKAEDTTMYYRLSALFKEHKGDLDSAQIYFGWAATRINATNDKLRKSSFYMRYGDFFERNNLKQEAIAQYRSAYLLASSLPYYEFMLEASDKLESIYVELKDYENAYRYGSINGNISDSLSNLLKKEELQLLEIENEEVLREQYAIKEKEETKRRNNIQYTAITILIATAFLLLLILGGFNVHPSLIRMVGFICFIFFFEFLILLFDTWIHHLTHGEPWKILAIKILLMIGLVPLHHFIEKKVTHYLISNKINWKPKKLFTFKKKAASSVVDEIE